MIPDVSEALSWLERHPDVLRGIGRGIEREALRIEPEGQLSSGLHPSKLGSALTHEWIITDYAEAMLEFVTPVSHDIDYLLAFLRDLHRYTVHCIGNEILWPFSMPGIIDHPENIKLAVYGKSNLGQMKHIYRRGLERRYGSLMQIISGIHYNFSLPQSFWQSLPKKAAPSAGALDVSQGYLGLIRNYHRYGWIICYLFGASPAIAENMLKDKSDSRLEYNGKDSYSMPWATSLRLSDLGYTNKAQSQLNISYNSLSQYLSAVKQALQTPSEQYANLGLTDEYGQPIQLNTNLLQIENELYASIRPKRVARAGETPAQALRRGGIEYIEVRSLDVNPFSAIGISDEQVYFLDLFLIWCALQDSPELDQAEQTINQQNWQAVVTEGRKPGLVLKDTTTASDFLLSEFILRLFADLQRIAVVMDQVNPSKGFWQAHCQQLANRALKPEQMYSARLLESIKQQGMMHTGLSLAEQYQQQLLHESLQVLTASDFQQQAKKSLELQQQIEENQRVDFEMFYPNAADKNTAT